MSLDYFYITPNTYTPETFIQRLPENIVCQRMKNGRYYIELGNCHSWLKTWDRFENGFFMLQDAFNEVQMKLINTIDNPVFYVVTAFGKDTLNSLTKLIGDDPNIFIVQDNDDPLLPGDEFVKKIQLGEI